MTDVTVTVRAEQRFEDWTLGEVRTVPRTRRVEGMIAAGRFTELADEVVAAQERVTQAVAEASTAATDLTTAQADARAVLAEATTPPPPRSRRRE